MTRLDDLAAAAEKTLAATSSMSMLPVDPTTILRLVAVAREAQRVAPHIHDETLDAALAALEE